MIVYKEGKEINDHLLKQEFDSVFINSKSKNSDSDAKEATKNIENHEKFNQNIVVCTSVIDNGVNITDLNLRNVVIMADTKEEFIQMLGRIRIKKEKNDIEEKKINLYIFKGKKGDFVNRKTSVKQIIRDIGEYKSYTYNMQQILEIEEFKNDIIKSNMYDKLYLNRVEDLVKYINEKERKSFGNILKKLLDSDRFYKFVKSTCYPINGCLVLNNFSDKQYKYLYDSYEKIINQFDKKGEYAFVEEQLKWVNIKKKERRKIIDEINCNLANKVASSIEKYVGRELSIQDNLKLREEIRLDLCTMLRECDKCNEDEIKNDITHLGKRSKNEKDDDEKGEKLTLSKERFNRIMKAINLEYEMDKPNSSTFKILKLSIENNGDL